MQRTNWDKVQLFLRENGEERTHVSKCEVQLEDACGGRKAMRFSSIPPFLRTAALWPLTQCHNHFVDIGPHQEIVHPAGCQ